MTWQEIKMMALNVKEDDVVEVDEYNNVDEYAWESWNDTAQ
jgi:hypothetical protein